MDNYQPVEQAILPKEFSTSDPFLIKKILTEKTNEYHLLVYFAFVDYEKAFDNVKLCAIERTMNNYRIVSRDKNPIHNIHVCKLK